MDYVRKTCINIPEKHIFLVIHLKEYSSVIRQKGESQKTFWKTNISYPLIRTRPCAYKEVRNIRFSKSLMFRFLVTSVLRFALFPYYRRIWNSKTSPSVLLNPFHANDSLLYLKKHQDTSDFLKFPGGIEKDQWHEMSQCYRS